MIHTAYHARADWCLRRLERAAKRCRADIASGFASEPAGQREALIEDAQDELTEIETEIKRRAGTMPTKQQSEDDMLLDQENRAN